MIRIETNVDINRPVSQVFAFIADLKNAGKWSTMATTRVSDGPIGMGTTFSSVARSEGKDRKSEWQVTAFERDKKLAFTGSGDGLAYTADMNFESAGGGTRMNYKFTLQLSGLMKLLEPLLASQVRKEEEGELKKLKQLLEA